MDVAIPEMVRPITCRANGAEELFGVKRDMLNKWVAEGKVVAFCEERAVFYDVESIDRTIHGLPKWAPNK